MRIHAATNRHGTRGYNVALVRSPDKGVTWSDDIFVNRLLVDDVTDTGWTLTIASRLLRAVGAPAVLPFALASTS